MIPVELKQIFRVSFEQITTTGYRPLNFVIHRAGVAFFSTPELSPYLWFAAVSIIVGTMAVCLFLALDAIRKAKWGLYSLYFCCSVLPR